MAGHVSGASIDLGRILAGECSATVTAPSAVGIDDDLATGQAAIAVGTTDDEIPGGVDVIDDIWSDHLGWQARLDDLLNDILFDLGVGHIRRVLGRDDDVVDPDRLVLIVDDRDLALGVRTQPVDVLVEASFGQSVGDAVRKGDGQRHQFFGVIASVSEHQALIASTDVFTGGVVFIDSLGDIRTLAVEGDHDVAGSAVDAPFVIGVPDIDDRLADDIGVVDDRFGGDLADDQSKTGRHDRFASHTAHGILSQ